MEHARYLVISGSLHPESRSRHLAKAAFERLEQLTENHSVSEPSGSAVQWIDLFEYPLPLCDGHSAYGAPNVAALSQKITAARGVLLASPIYNYDVNAAIKNMIELTGRAWQDKVVGMMCAAGGQGSYMSGMGLANSLMLDFRCLIVPRFVYATGESFEGDHLADDDIQTRVDQIVDDLADLSRAVREINGSE